MNEWKKSVKTREGYTAKQAQCNLLSELTLEGISITGMFHCVQMI